jgi:hypothetical protein
MLLHDMAPVPSKEISLAALSALGGQRSCVPFDRMQNGDHPCRKSLIADLAEQRRLGTFRTPDIEPTAWVIEGGLICIYGVSFRLPVPGV